MIRSMTGFGRCRETVDGLDITVEIKSVNSRFLDCNTKISRAYSYLEERIKPYLISRGIARGKVDVWITVEVLDSGATEISLDEGYLKGYLDALYRLRDAYGLRDDISVMSVARNQELFQVKKPEEDVERDWARVKNVLDKATDAFLAVRSREGESLARDMRAKLESIRASVTMIERLSEQDITTYRERLAERIREALEDNHITPDETRLLTECAIHADKVAVDEEMVRLRTHFDAFEEILSGGEPVGRKLDFLLQEMNREINTTGSKCSDAQIARTVVDVKCELEKIREQIQNLE
ncbi:MAG: YicC family protein [Clostridia bacterium]|nr:YicC family protein [Clostridia bacterium]